MRIGIDVGGTNTDAVLMDGASVVSWYKTRTTPDVSSGIISALEHVLHESQAPTDRILGVMIGTTHFTNAIVERKHVIPVAAVRVALPATESLPPMVDWPPDLRDTLGNHTYLVHGGHEFDGREIAPLGQQELADVAADIRRKGLRSVAITSVFSPVNSDREVRAAEILRQEVPGLFITFSHEIGRIGLLERENAAIMNACVRELAERLVNSFRDALGRLHIDAPFYISQNDGTLMNADFAEKYPVLTFASGPTNSMRGAAFLSGVKEAMVIDVGGTTSDVGMLMHGFPREPSAAVAIGGVRTNFRMPDVLSFGLGGGSLVRENGAVRVGPDSVGYELTTRGLIFGGDTLTTTDVAVASGYLELGEVGRVASLRKDLVNRTLDEIQRSIDAAVDRMRTSAAPLPVILVGGGSILIGRPIQGASEVLKPEHFAVANAIGAAIAQIGGDVDRVFSLDNMTLDQALEHAKEEAVSKAIEAGADAASVQVVDVDEVPLTYLPSNAMRVRVKAVGDLLLPQRAMGVSCD